MKIPFRIFSFICLSLLFFCGTGSSEEYVWNFDDNQEIKNWTTMNADLKQTRDGVISISGHGKDSFMLFSPSNLNIPPDFSCIEFKLRVPPTNPYGYILIKTTDNRIGREKYEFSDPNEFHVYIINIKKATLSNVAIDSFTFAFDGGVEVEFDYVKFYKPLSIQIVKGYWRQFWKVSYIIQGVGHDFGIGFFEDDLGDDYYWGGTLVQGAATNGSLGLFIDSYGNDRYICAEKGQAFAEEDGIGIMIDTEIRLGVNR